VPFRLLGSNYCFDKHLIFHQRNLAHYATICTRDFDGRNQQIVEGIRKIFDCITFSELNSPKCLQPVFMTHIHPLQ